MGEKETPKDPGEARREQILKAAAALFAEKGYQRATVKEIAARAGVAPGTIYLYFENKRDLLLAIADRLIAQPVDQILVEASRLDAEAYVATIIRNRIQFARQNQALLQALVTEIWTDEELREQFFAQVIGPIIVAGAAYLQARVAEGKLRPCRPEIVAPAVAGAIIILSALRVLAPDYLLAGVSDEELVEELTRLYLYGLQPCPEGVTG
ncbi:MAG TPA: TetR/AcrR family transcriptional regulator [Anaerolineales bacterium]|nr:TetR/AcrR family transcriptional regulator [Anaerolineae bacterium]HIQ02757.1 TetR/AcrR family transcriptional regulator [Anaerolineales bacterium]